MDNIKIKRQSNFLHRYLEKIDPTDSKQLTNIVYVYVAGFFLLWFSIGIFTQNAPHWDNVEALVWSEHLQWGYFKHPPFATWIVHFFVSVFGRSFWVTYLAAQLSVALMLLVVWRISLLVTTPGRALIAVILTSLIIYHNVWGIVANHNTFQLLPVALLLWGTLLAVRDPRWWRWGLVGLVAAVCLLTKYSAAIWFAVLGIWMVLEPRMHRIKPWLGVLLAVLIGLLAVAPHIEWLMREGYQTLKYLENQTHQKANYFSLAGRFLLSQLGRTLPVFIALIALYLSCRKHVVRSQICSLGAELLPREWRFICLMTVGPLLLALVAGMFMMNLRANWGTTLFILAGLCATRWLPALNEKLLIQTVIKIGVAINLTLAAWMAVSNSYLVDALGRTSRVNFPVNQYVSQIDKIWFDSMGAEQPLRIIAGETWLAGIVSVKSTYHPSAFLYGRKIQAPWISEQTIRDCGVLLIVDRRGTKNRPPPPAVLEMMKSAAHAGKIDIPWSRRSTGPQLSLDWGIIEPVAKGLCK